PHVLGRVVHDGPKEHRRKIRYSRLLLPPREDTHDASPYRVMYVAQVDRQEVRDRATQVIPVPSGRSAVTVGRTVGAARRIGECAGMDRAEDTRGHPTGGNGTEPHTR